MQAPVTDICAVIEIERYCTPDDPVAAFAGATNSDYREDLYTRAVAAMRMREQRDRMTTDRVELALRSGEERFGTGRLLSVLRGGYTHKTDLKFVTIMDSIISHVEGGISYGVYDPSGKLVMRPTNRGVEDRFYAVFLSRRKLYLRADVTDLSKDDTREILYRDVWKFYNLHMIDYPAVAALIFDGVLNSGHRSISNLVRQHIPRDVLGIENPTTFGARAAFIINTIAAQSEEARDRLLINMMRQRRKIMETAHNFYSVELGGMLQQRLQRLEQYTRDNLHDKTHMQRYLSDPTTGQSHSFYRLFLAQTS
jgi:lysozyme family protein